MFDPEKLAAWNPAPFLEALRRAGFTFGGLEALGVEQRPPPEDGLPASAAVEDSALGTLLRLFLEERAVPAEHAMRVFGGELNELMKIGLLRADGRSAVLSEVRLVALKDGWFAADPVRRQRAGEPDFVMGLSPTTRVLAGLSPAWSGARALDLGTGAGWNAFRMAARGAEVVATDINPRAIGIARLNARLGGATVDFREGDLFEPVRGETFDVIASNPPFVITPDNTYLFRDHPRGGEYLCREVVRAIPSHLRPGGVGCLLLNWHHATDDDWAAQPLAWTDDLGCHRWIFRTECLSPADYARRWLAHEPRHGDPEETFRRWLAHYEAIGARRFSFGFVVMQSCPEGKPWTRSEARGEMKVDAEASDEVLRILANETWLAREPTDEFLLAARFPVPDGITAHAEMSLAKTGWQRRTIRLQSPRRLAYDGQVDENLLRLLEHCRAGKTPADMVAELRGRPELTGMDLDLAIAGLTRDLVRFGLLDAPPAGHGDPEAMPQA